jgi:hypothetical protein
MTNPTELPHTVEQEDSAQPFSDPGSPGQETDWAEIGQHFWVLGESLTNAFRAAWQHEENRQQLHKLQTGLQEVAEQVSQAVKGVVESPEFRQARLEVDKAAQPAQIAGQRAFHEIHPHLLTALHQLRSEIDKLISRLEQPLPDADEPAVPETPLQTEGPASLVRGSPPNAYEL